MTIHMGDDSILCSMIDAFIAFPPPSTGRPWCNALHLQFTWGWMKVRSYQFTVQSLHCAHSRFCSACRQ